MYDPFHDPGAGRLHQLYGKFPKLASLLNNSQIQGTGHDLPDTAFAWPAERRFPLHTPKMAALSHAYATEQSVPAEVVAAIKEALDAYQVPAEVFEEPLTKIAEDPDDYLFPGARLYPVRNATEAKTAEERLLSQVQRLHPNARTDAFVRLHAKAAKFNVTLQNESHKYAGLTETDVQELKDQLRARAAATTDEDARGAYEKLAAEVGKRPRDLRARSNQVKLADAISDLDVKAGLVPHYYTKLADPVAAVFNTTKVAQPSVELGNKTFPLTRLAALDPSFYGDALGPDFVREVTSSDGRIDPGRLLDVLQTLPLDMKRNLAQGLANTGR